MNTEKQTQVLRLPSLPTPATKTCRWGPRYATVAQDDSFLLNELLTQDTRSPRQFFSTLAKDQPRFFPPGLPLGRLPEGLAL